MLYARVALGLAVSSPFDYIVPPELSRKIKVGSRVWVTLRNKKIAGYVVGLTHKTSVKGLKSIISVIDEKPLLDASLLSLTKSLSEYYCSNWGEAIETVLPESLRKGRPVPGIQAVTTARNKSSTRKIILHVLTEEDKWGFYFKCILDSLNIDLSLVMLFPDVTSLEEARARIKDKLGCEPCVLYRGMPKELEVWERIRQGEEKIILGTRSTVFAPAVNLGMIIIDREDQSVYKQDQSPHYHAREIALLRQEKEGIDLVLSSPAPSLESFSLVGKRGFRYEYLSKSNTMPEIKIIDTRHLPYLERKKKPIFTKLLLDEISGVLESKGRCLIFLNRKGFATSAACHNCGITQKCIRCSTNLIFNFDQNILSCPYCSFRVAPPEICPHCNAGYIKYSGAGTERIESEVARVFPQASIERLDESGSELKDADIVVATSAIIGSTTAVFDLVAILGIDNYLNRPDFRASEKAFAMLCGLLGLAKKRMIIQSRLSGHHCFEALIKKDPGIFYEKELKYRKQLNFPPFSHMIMVKVRGKDAEKVEATCIELLAKLKEANKSRSIRILSANRAQPFKLRGNFYWNILINSASPLAAGKFLRFHLKDFRRSGIIINVEVDPL